MKIVLDDLLHGEMEESAVAAFHPIKFAFVGDAIYECYVRMHLVKERDLNTHKLAMMSSRYVKAVAQSGIVKELQPELSEEEWAWVLRGRNQKHKSVPKNASVSDYAYATGFETLLGFLLMTGQTARMEELIRKSIEIVEKRERDGQEEGKEQVSERGKERNRERNPESEPESRG